MILFDCSRNHLWPWEMYFLQSKEPELLSGFLKIFIFISVAVAHKTATPIGRKVLEQLKNRRRRTKAIKLPVAFCHFLQRLLYLQTREYICQGRLFCPPDMAFLLASYAVQERYGDHNPYLHKPRQIAQLDLIPKRCVHWRGIH